MRFLRQSVDWVQMTSNTGCGHHTQGCLAGTAAGTSENEAPVSSASSGSPGGPSGGREVLAELTCGRSPQAPSPGTSRAHSEQGGPLLHELGVALGSCSLHMMTNDLAEISRLPSKSNP